jgi:hypothetical protein
MPTATGLAKRGLLDFLEEEGDPRREAVDREEIDWLAVAQQLAGTQQPQIAWFPVSGELARYRYYVDCARYGAGARPEVVEAVRVARQQWLQGLFPEVDLAGP